MVEYVAVFPGQGSQQVNMGLDIYEKSARVRSLFSLASEVSHLDLYKILKNGSLDEITETSIAQVVITLVNRSCSIVLKELGFTAVAAGGFSLGELSAYREAQMISEEDLFSITSERGKLMARNASEITHEYGDLAMAAVIGLSFETVEKAIIDSGESQVFVSNDNSVNQVVISGVRSSVERMEIILKKLKAHRVMYLNVSGPFHTPLMNDAKRELEEYLQHIDFSQPKIPVYSNVTGKLLALENDIRSVCASQIVSPVRWRSITENIVSDYSRFEVIEVGYGKVLSGFFKRTPIRCHQSGTIEKLNQISEHIKVE